MKVVFFDRDNTLNYDPGYLSDPDAVTLLPYVIDGLRILKELGYSFIVITNQSGIGRGYFTLGTLFEIHARLLSLFEKENIFFTDIFFCPHTDDDGCHCRKPKPGLIEMALKKYPVNLQESWIIGDRIADIETGSYFSLKGILLGNKKEIHPAPENLLYVADNLYEAAIFIKNYKSFL